MPLSRSQLMFKFSAAATFSKLAQGSRWPNCNSVIGESLLQPHWQANGQICLQRGGVLRGAACFLVLVKRCGIY